MTVAGAHISIDELEKDLTRVLDEQEVLGNKNVVCPHLAENRRSDADGWRQVARSLNSVGQQCQRRGLNLAYHNHSFEFQSFDAGPTVLHGSSKKTGLDLLWENSDINLVRAELDVYWVQHAGLDPTDYINKLGRRILLVHLKDMASGSERQFAPVGEGIIQFKEILAAAESAGAQWGVVEQDSTYNAPPLEAIQISFRNLQAMGAV